ADEREQRQTVVRPSRSLEHISRLCIDAERSLVITARIVHVGDADQQGGGLPVILSERAFPHPVCALEIFERPRVLSSLARDDAEAEQRIRYANAVGAEALLDRFQRADEQRFTAVVLLESHVETAKVVREGN